MRFVHRPGVEAVAAWAATPSVGLMFGRPPSLDSDAVAAARRRLAVLAAQFEAAAAESPQLGPRDGATPPTPDAPRGPSLLPPVDVDDTADPGDTGRHRGGTGSSAYARWHLSPHHVAVAALIVTVAMAVGAWWVLRSAPDPQPVGLTSQRSLPPSANAPAGTGAPSVPTTGGAPAPTQTSGKLIVDVAGKVRRPGIVELPAGARVVDALNAAGGARPGIDTAALNLARPLLDGEQIVVGLTIPTVGVSIGPTTGTSTTSSAIAPVNLNTATQAELETLPGIGPVTAQAILAWRTDNSAFTSVDELLEVSGIGDATLADIEPYVYV